MKPPRNVRVGPLRYAIKYDPGAMKAANANGMCCRDQETILLQTGQAPGVERDTVLHEVLHAIWAQTHLLKDMNDADEDSDGEKAVNVLAPAILAMLRQNPKLVQYLMEK